MKPTKNLTNKVTFAPEFEEDLRRLADEVIQQYLEQIAAREMYFQQMRDWYLYGGRR